MKYTLGLIALTISMQASANYFCTGTVRYLGTDIDLHVSNGYGVHKLCNLEENRCKAWLSMAMSAKMADKPITIYYLRDGGPGGEQGENGACSEIGNWVTPSDPPYHVSFQ